jgi:hypothetical protein
MGPVDYIVIEWSGDRPVTGEAMRALLDVVERGLVRILDLAFLAKEADGSVSALDLAELAQHDSGLAEFEGAASGLLGQDDLRELCRPPPPRGADGGSPGSPGRTGSHSAPYRSTWQLTACPFSCPSICASSSLKSLHRMRRATSSVCLIPWVHGAARAAALGVATPLAAVVARLRRTPASVARVALTRRHGADDQSAAGDGPLHLLSQTRVLGVGEVPL